MSNKSFVEVVGSPWDYVHSPDKAVPAYFVQRFALRRQLPRLMREIDPAYHGPFIDGKEVPHPRGSVRVDYYVGKDRTVEGGYIRYNQTRPKKTLMLQDVTGLIPYHPQDLASELEQLAHDFESTDIRNDWVWFNYVRVLRAYRPFRDTLAEVDHVVVKSTDPTEALAGGWLFGHTDETVYHCDINGAYLSEIAKVAPSAYQMWYDRQSVKGRAAKYFLKLGPTVVHGKLLQQTPLAARYYQAEDHFNPDLYYHIVEAIRNRLRSVITPLRDQGRLIRYHTDGFICRGDPTDLLDAPTGTGKLGHWRVEQSPGITIIHPNLFWSTVKTCTGVIPTATLNEDLYLKHLAENGGGEFGVTYPSSQLNWDTFTKKDVKLNLTRVHAPHLCDACKRGQSFTEALHHAIEDADVDV